MPYRPNDSDLLPGWIGKNGAVGWQIETIPPRGRIGSIVTAELDIGDSAPLSIEWKMETPQTTFNFTPLLRYP